MRREPPDESDYRFWLQWAGVTLNGETAREYVRMQGLPPPLDELAIGLFGPQKATLVPETVTIESVEVRKVVGNA